MATDTLLPDSVGEQAEAAAGSRTWKLDIDGGRLLYEIDGTEALKQAVQVMLSVPRYEHLIFSDEFGHELSGLVGKDPDYIAAAAPALVEEALMTDERIRGVEDLTLETDGDEAHIRFTVLSEESFAVSTDLEGGN